MKLASKRLRHMTSALTTDTCQHVLRGIGKDVAAKLDAMLAWLQ